LYFLTAQNFSAPGTLQDKQHSAPHYIKKKYLLLFSYLPGDTGIAYTINTLFFVENVQSKVYKVNTYLAPDRDDLVTLYRLLGH
jgi:hypothetical protein